MKRIPDFHRQGPDCRSRVGATIPAVGLVTLCLLALCIQFTTQAAADERPYPNIVFVLADDLGYGDLSCYNADSKVSTPNLDRLAKGGIRFTDAHSGAAVCSPTRYGLLTGRHFLRRPNWIEGILNRCLIDEEQLTVAEYLQAHGYHTSCFGKWHLGQTWFDKQGQLFDLSTDAKQANNVWSTHPAIVEELTNLHTNHRRRGRSVGIDR